MLNTVYTVRECVFVGVCVCAFQGAKSYNLLLPTPSASFRESHCARACVTLQFLNIASTFFSLSLSLFFFFFTAVSFSPLTQVKSIINLSPMAT